MANEKAITNRILKYLDDRGVVAWKAGAGPFQRSGISDILAVLPPRGRLLAIEVKDPSRRDTKYGGLTPAQRDFQNWVRFAGALAMTAYGLESVRVVVEAELRSAPFR